MRLNKVTARVFCTLNGGKQSGNPVTIFASLADDDSPIPPQTQVRLAQQCTWESVMVDTKRQVLQFYMPTGEQVNFCAHAAMGGVTQLPHTMEQPLTFYSAMQIGNKQERQSTATVHDGNVVSLELRETWKASKVEQPASLHRLLREACGINASSLVAPPPSQQQHAWPTFWNYSTARNKTLVYLNSPTALHQAIAPSNPTVFQRACDALDTTGLYLYTPKTTDDHHDDDDEITTTRSFECRQFPRASAYPEDPATGIAASALAVALQKEQEAGALQQRKRRQQPAVAYKFYQGTAMGRPSLIHVDNLEFHSSDDDNDDEGNEQVSFRLLGQVQIDTQEEIEEDC